MYLRDIREITIQFSPDLFFGNVVNKNQFDSIRRMLERAQCGLSFHAGHHEGVQLAG